MIRRSKDENVNAKRRRKAEKTKAPKKGSRKSSQDARKGRGKRARETIREGQPEPRQKPKGRTVSDAGPPIRTSHGSAGKHVTGITPEQVVSSIRGRKR